MLSAKLPFLRSLIGDRAFYKRLLLLVVPMIIQHTVTNVVNLLDNLMVGAIGKVPMAAVTIVNQLYFVFMLCIFGGLAGTGIFSTQYAGAKDDDGLRRCFRLKLHIATAMVIIFSWLFTCFPEIMFSWFLQGEAAVGEAQQTLEYCHEYMNVMLMSMVPLAICFTYANTLRELGETRIPMLGSIIAMIVNLAFNYVLIFGKLGFPALGITGAAIATVIARCAEMLTVVIYTHASSAKFTFIKGAYRTLKVPFRLFADVCRRGGMILVNELLWSSSIAALLYCYSMRGLDVIAAFNVAMIIANLFNCIYLAMGSAVGVIIGQELGAQRIDEAKISARRLLATTVASSLVMGIVLACAAPWLPSLFNIGKHVQELSTMLILICVLVVPVRAYSHAIYFTLLAGGCTVQNMLMDSIFSWTIVIPVTWAIGRFTDMPIIPFYLLSNLMEILRCIVSYIMYASGRWSRNLISNQ
ncbi:MAG: MATE family efflux transporter [Victivallales bacterium]|nr:MATE family efflux transporter [Victivallales bacterium]